MTKDLHTTACLLCLMICVQLLSGCSTKTKGWATRQMKQHMKEKYGLEVEIESIQGQSSSYGGVFYKLGGYNALPTDGIHLNISLDGTVRDTYQTERDFQGRF